MRITLRGIDQIAYIGAAIDGMLDALARSTEQLRDSERLYRESFVLSSAVKLLVDPDSLAIVDANLAAAEFYGYPIATLTLKVTTFTPSSIMVAPFGARRAT